MGGQNRCPRLAFSSSYERHVPTCHCQHIFLFPPLRPHSISFGTNEQVEVTKFVLHVVRWHLSVALLWCKQLQDWDLVLFMVYSPQHLWLWVWSWGTEALRNQFLRLPYCPFLWQISSSWLARHQSMWFKETLTLSILQVQVWTWMTLRVSAPYVLRCPAGLTLVWTCLLGKEHSVHGPKENRPWITQVVDCVSWPHMFGSCLIGSMWLLRPVPTSVGPPMHCQHVRASVWNVQCRYTEQAPELLEVCRQIFKEIRSKKENQFLSSRSLFCVSVSS